MMAQGRVEGSIFFPSNFQAAKNSFLWAMYLMPLYLYMMYRVQMEIVGFIPELSAFFVIQLSAYSLYWVVYPLIVYYLVRYVERSAAYPAYISMYNWLKATQIILLSVLSALGEIGWLNETIFTVLNTVLMVLIIIAEWNIVRFGLRLRGIMPLTFLLLDGTIGLIITASAESLLPR